MNGASWLLRILHYNYYAYASFNPRRINGCTFQSFGVGDPAALYLHESQRNALVGGASAPDTSNSSLKWLLLSELNYGCILILCALALVRKPSDYANAPILEQAVQYADCMISLTQVTDQSTL